VPRIAEIQVANGQALSARLHLLGFIVERRPQDDPAIDRHDLELERQALAVAVEPGGSDLGPEGFVAAIADMPGDEIRSFGLGRAGGG